MQLKEAARARARAAGVAQVQHHLHEDEPPAELKVVNAVIPPSSSILSTAATCGDNDREPAPPSPARDLPPSLVAGIEYAKRALPVPSGAQTWSRPSPSRFNTAETMIFRPASSRPALGPIAGMPTSTSSDSIAEVAEEDKPIVPSLETIERAAAAKSVLEQHYWSILKRPRDRDTRLAQLERELIRLRLSDGEKRKIRELFAQNESDHLREVRRRVSPGSFKVVKAIGHGAFGVVSLVKERETGELFAMKQLRKNECVGAVGCADSEACCARARRVTSGPSATSSRRPPRSRAGSSASPTRSRTSTTSTSSWSTCPAAICSTCSSSATRFPRVRRRVLC